MQHEDELPTSPTHHSGFPPNRVKSSYFDTNSDNEGMSSRGIHSSDFELSDFGTDDGIFGEADRSVYDDGFDSEEEEWLLYIENLPIWKSPLIRLCFMLFLVGVAFTVSGPSMEVITYKLACQLIIKNSGWSLVPDQCDAKETQGIVSTYFMWDMLISSIVSLIVCTKVTSLSDVHGRKPFLSAFVILLVVSSFAKYVLIVTSDGFPMWRMWFFTLIGSLSGGAMALVALFKAYLTDVTRPISRVSAMGYTGVAFALGQIVGPSLSSLVLTQAKKAENEAVESTGNLIPASELVPVKLSLLILVTASLFCVFLLPESRPRHRRAKAAPAQGVLLPSNTTHIASYGERIYMTIKGFFAPMRLLTFPEEFKTDSNAADYHRLRVCVFNLSIIDIMQTCVVISVILIEPQYCIYEFKWDSITLANYTIAKAIVNIAAIGCILPILYKVVFPRIETLTPQSHTFDAADTTVVISGLLVLSLCQLGASFASNGSTFVTFAIIAASAGLHGPVVGAASVKYFPSSRVGEYYGAIALAQGSINSLMPFISTALFRYGIKSGFPGLPFIFNSAITLSAVACALRARLSVREASYIDHSRILA